MESMLDNPSGLIFLLSHVSILFDWLLFWLLIWMCSTCLCIHHIHHFFVSPHLVHVSIIIDFHHLLCGLLNCLTVILNGDLNVSHKHSPHSYTYCHISPAPCVHHICYCHLIVIIYDVCLTLCMLNGSRSSNDSYDSHLYVTLKTFSFLTSSSRIFVC